MTDRRQFLKQTGTAGAALAMVSAMPRGAHATPLAAASREVERFEGGAPKELMMEALNAAKSAGASWADARIARFRQNFVVTREHQIVNVVDTDTLGCGVRALVDGCWGFAATRYLTTASVIAAAREAVAIAKANRVARDPRVGAPERDVEERVPHRSVGRAARGQGLPTPQGQRGSAEGPQSEVCELHP